MGVKFEKEFKDGRRRFDFFCPEKGILIEINRMGNLEKVAEPWEEYAKSKGYKLLLVPNIDVLNDFRDKTHIVEQKIKDLIAGKDVPTFVEGEGYNRGPLFVSKNVPDRELFTKSVNGNGLLRENALSDIIQALNFLGDKWKQTKKQRSGRLCPA